LSTKKERKAKRAVFAVMNMDCATCAMAIERKLKKVDGIKGVGSAIMLNKIFVDYDESKLGLGEIKKAIKEAGYSNYVIGNDNEMR
jgi:P-type Cu+ transporter